jgi:2',3'-cyclic-nucleotide 2'-phosphodiesterase (5'-nucleotidase family)
MFMLEGMQAIGYDAINLGERDFLLGAQFLLDMKQKFQLPLISANVYYADSTTRFLDPYIIRTYSSGGLNLFKKSLRIGIFGVVMQRQTLSYGNESINLITKDPIITAKQIVAEMRDKCDVIIALVHLTSLQVNKLVEEVPEINILVGTHEYSPRTAAIQIGDSWLIQTGSKGQYIGNINILLDEQRRITSLNGVVESLGSNISDDHSINALISKYEKTLEDVLSQKVQENNHQ